MKKIKDSIIRLLGGVTEKEMRCQRRTASVMAREAAFEEVLDRMTSNYGMSSSEWCKDVYDFVKSRAEEAAKS